MIPVLAAVFVAAVAVHTVLACWAAAAAARIASRTAIMTRSLPGGHGRRRAVPQTHTPPW